MGESMYEKLWFVCLSNKHRGTRFIRPVRCRLLLSSRCQQPIGRTCDCTELLDKRCPIRCVQPHGHITTKRIWTTVIGAFLPAPPRSSEAEMHTKRAPINYHFTPSKSRTTCRVFVPSVKGRAKVSQRAARNIPSLGLAGLPHKSAPSRLLPRPIWCGFKACEIL